MAKRIDEIRQKVETEGEVFVSDLSRIYNVTEETIRRDLEKLKNDGIITRTFGGAVLNTTPQNDRVHFFKRKGINLEGKKKIAKLLVDKFIGVNTMMIDNSTTVLEAVKLFKDNENLTAITFSAQIFQELDTCKMKLVSTGGGLPCILTNTGLNVTDLLLLQDIIFFILFKHFFNHFFVPNACCCTDNRHLNEHWSCNR